jgi:X-Pro dipeptidyl-peptidase
VDVTFGRWATLLCALPLVSLGLAAPASAAPQEPVRETVWVDTGQDSDGNGVPDRVAVDVARPAGPGRVPTIVDASPYYSCCGRGNENQRKTYDPQGRPVGFPQFYDNHFVPRGYATVLVDLAGTNRSAGCPDVGGPSDVASARAVVDWLGGRARGYDSPAGGRPADAGWSSGNVGMIGKSYDGTIANGVAATGAPNLRTIVPISAISSWYDYYRSDGASTGSNPDELAGTVSEHRPGCERMQRQLARGAPANGDMTPLWRDRDYVPDAGKVRASVFAVHGRNDLNVKPVQFGQWWDALAARGVPRKVWLSQTGHVDPFDYRRGEWVSTLDRWFDHWLRGAPNGIAREPAASIERSPDHWVDEPRWSGERAQPVAVHPGPAGLGTAPATGQRAFTDDPQKDETAWAAHPDQPDPSRLAFTSAPLQHDLRLAGTGSITATATPSTPTAHLSAVLVDYGPAAVRDTSGPGEGIRTLPTSSCWGQSRPGDSACYHDTAATTAAVDHQIVTRGWADLGHHDSPTHQEPLRPGEPVRMTFRLNTADHVIPAGHRLGLVIGGTDRGQIVPPAQPGQVRIDLGGTSTELPAVGGPDAVAAALRK